MKLLATNSDNIFSADTLWEDGDNWVFNPDRPYKKVIPKKAFPMQYEAAVQKYGFRPTTKHDLEKYLEHQKK